MQYSPNLQRRSDDYNEMALVIVVDSVIAVGLEYQDRWWRSN